MAIRAHSPTGHTTPVSLFACIKLTINDDVLDYMVEKSIEFKLGARGLRSIMEAIQNNAMYEQPSDSSKKEFLIDRS